MNIWYAEMWFQKANFALTVCTLHQSNSSKHTLPTQLPVLYLTVLWALCVSVALTVHSNPVQWVLGLRCPWPTVFCSYIAITHKCIKKRLVLILKNSIWTDLAREPVGNRADKYVVVQRNTLKTVLFTCTSCALDIGHWLCFVLFFFALHYYYYSLPGVSQTISMFLYPVSWCYHCVIVDEWRTWVRYFCAVRKIRQLRDVEWVMVLY